MSTPVCNTNLPNLGSGDCKLVMSAQRRVMFTSKLKEDGTPNKISKTNAALIVQWQTLFDKPNFSATVLEKVVPSAWVFKLVNEQGEPVVYDEDGDYEKLKDGTYNISFEIHSVVADYIKKMKSLEEANLCVYFIDEDNRLWGRVSGTDIYPLQITGLSVPNFNLKTAAAPSVTMVKFRVKYPDHMNELISVDMNSDVSSDSDFYSLIDVDSTVTAPAITGCVVALETARYGDAVIGFVFGDFIFYDAIAPTVGIPLTLAAQLVESPAGTYTLNKAALLTTGHTYTLKITHSRYDVATASVVVP